MGQNVSPGKGILRTSSLLLERVLEPLRYFATEQTVWYRKMPKRAITRAVLRAARQCLNRRRAVIAIRSISNYTTYTKAGFFTQLDLLWAQSHNDDSSSLWRFLSD